LRCILKVCLSAQLCRPSVQASRGVQFSSNAGVSRRLEYPRTVLQLRPLYSLSRSPVCCNVTMLRGNWSFLRRGSQQGHHEHRDEGVGDSEMCSPHKCTINPSADTRQCTHDQFRVNSELPENQVLRAPDKPQCAGKPELLGKRNHRISPSHQQILKALARE